MSGSFEEYIIRIKYKSEFRNVYIKANELTVQDFLNKGNMEFCLFFCICEMNIFVLLFVMKMFVVLFMAIVI